MFKKARSINNRYAAIELDSKYAQQYGTCNAFRGICSRREEERKNSEANMNK
jgi:hypothetical protein